ncbi:MAG: hypothetical protein EX272_09595 [Chromatiales bacterium]|nr:MAG: hypothetical protein EX272_09595 [Chromatiales bacterium]
MIKQVFLVCVFLLALPIVANGEELEGDYLYKVTSIRAASGALADLLDWQARMKASRYYDQAGQEHPLLMRHSQGDQWDLLVVVPMQSWIAYHSEKATHKRRDAAARHAELIADGQRLFAFYEDHFAYGPSWSTVKNAYAENAFFHIEMFEAAPGKANELLEQRRMENNYLETTGQTPNMIFRRAAGSDVDVFTIGFHPSFEAFAAPADVTVEEKEQVAKAVGFKGLADISFYLRSLISGHHDTLATKVD